MKTQLVASKSRHSTIFVMTQADPGHPYHLYYIVKNYAITAIESEDAREGRPGLSTAQSTIPRQSGVFADQGFPWWIDRSGDGGPFRGIL